MNTRTVLPRVALVLLAVVPRAVPDAGAEESQDSPKYPADMIHCLGYEVIVAATNYVPLQMHRPLADLAAPAEDEPELPDVGRERSPPGLMQAGGFPASPDSIVIEQVRPRDPAEVDDPLSALSREEDIDEALPEPDAIEGWGWLARDIFRSERRNERESPLLPDSHESLWAYELMREDDAGMGWDQGVWNRDRGSMMPEPAEDARGVRRPWNKAETTAAPAAPKPFKWRYEKSSAKP